MLQSNWLIRTLYLESKYLSGGNTDLIVIRSFPRSGLIRKKSCGSRSSSLRIPAFCRMAMDKGPHVVFGSEKRTWFISTDICLLCSKVGAMKRSEVSYSFICSSFVSGPDRKISPFVIISSVVVCVAVAAGIGVDVGAVVGVNVNVGVTVIVAVEVG